MHVYSDRPSLSGTIAGQSPGNIDGSHMHSPNADLPAGLVGKKAEGTAFIIQLPLI
jgi:hypothetical protein